VDWLQFAVQWLHVIAAITWFGAVIYADFVLIPALMTLPPIDQRRTGEVLGKRADKVITPAAIATVVLGILRGTVFGPVKTVEFLGTSYGITWLVALILGIGLLYWGTQVLGAALGRFNAFDISRTTLADGSPNPEYTALVADVRLKGLLEFVGFLAIFTCMILMRFGL
jgi:uncharacterized membrane protein